MVARMTVRVVPSTPTKVPETQRGASSRMRNSHPGIKDGTTNRRWVWQTIPVLQLPPVRTTANLPPIRPSESRPRTLVANLERRILRVKQEEGVESVVRRAEEILRARQKSALGRWANSERDFVVENRRHTAGPWCCRRKEQEDAAKRAKTLRNLRRSTAVRLRNERQRLLIKSRGVANSEVRRCMATRDRAFAELVYRRIYTRTGGNARAWAVIVASIIRLQFMHAAVGKEARRHQEELTTKSMAVVGRFLCRAIVKRRRIRAVQIIAGALGAFTNSNVIRRYAGRVRWGARRLQTTAHQRAACMTDHLDLLSRHWDRLYPPPTCPPALQTPKEKALVARKPPRVAASTTSSTAATKTTKQGVSSESGGARNSKRSPRGKVGGGKQKTKGDPKRQGGGSPTAKARVKGGDGGESALISATEECEVRGGSESGAREGVMDVFGEAKKEEIVAWLRRTRSKHSQDRIIYERFTVFPMMVELLLQHEGETYHSRLRAIEHVASLRARGQLSRTWVDKGYYAKMAHVVPPPPRMPRLFNREDGDAMFERATAKFAAVPGPAASI